ncbi:hypothetical protein C6496_11000 [Candidatus Poribacteria bacterium]|nr:MAG: hypothetical protein C6496_11000 [Candidatus Poribacteria bacterium]
MKLGFYMVYTLLLTLSIYVILKGFSVSETQLTPQDSHSNRKGAIHITESIRPKENCACCAKKISPAKEKAKQQQEVREAWARQLITDHGYEEGMRQIMIESPGLAKQMQRLFDKEKRLGQKHAVSQSIVP